VDHQHPLAEGGNIRHVVTVKRIWPHIAGCNRAGTPALYWALTSSPSVGSSKKKHLVDAEAASSSAHAFAQGKFSDRLVELTLK